MGRMADNIEWTSISYRRFYWAEGQVLNYWYSGGRLEPSSGKVSTTIRTDQVLSPASDKCQVSRRKITEL